MALMGRDIVCVSVMDWGHPFPTSRHALMRLLAERNRVLFVDSLQNPLTTLRGCLSAPSRARLARWGGFLPALRYEDPLWVLTPPPGIPCAKLPPGLAFDAAYRINQALMRHAVRSGVRRLEMTKPILWLSFSVLASEGVVGALDEALVVYHCTDDIGALPGVPAIAPDIERRLIAGADLVVCSSAELARRTGGLCVPNGVDVERFGSARSLDVRLAPELRALAGGRIVIGYSGQIDERFDFTLWEELGQARPGWLFVAVGGMAPAVRETCWLLARRRSNIRFLGLVRQDRLPEFFKGFAVGTLPWRLTAQTRAIYPLKLHEYLAAGLPVVATPFADLPDACGSVRFAAGPTPFLAALEAALLERDQPAAIADRQATAARASWGRRLAQIEGLIEATETGPLRPPGTIRDASTLARS